MKIAWIEDDAPVIESLIYPLKKEGFVIQKFVTVAEAKGALDAIRSADLILLDVILPPGAGEKALTRYPGQDLLREWRSASLELPPVIVLTAVRNPEVLDDLRRMGVAHIISKPTLPSDLQKKIHEVLDARHPRSS
jgi:two-component system, OmpR family, catabolic regulation response regulator CreB